MPYKQRQFNFEDVCYDRSGFRSQIHIRDPKPFSPRWISGYAILPNKRGKKSVPKPLTKSPKKPTKRNYANRSSTHSTVHLDHDKYLKSRPKTAPENIYRIYDSTKPVPCRFNKRQFSKTHNPHDRSICPLRTGKRIVVRPKTQQNKPKSIRLFPTKKAQTFDKSWAYIPTRGIKIDRNCRKTTIQKYISPTTQLTIPNASAYPRKNLKDVWRSHTPQNTKSSISSFYTNRTIMKSILGF